tara:strand:- start:20 stop:286 length:267 start_codon:yes stop_codon:yes gene_type:complete
LGYPAASSSAKASLKPASTSTEPLLAIRWKRMIFLAMRIDERSCVPQVVALLRDRSKPPPDIGRGEGGALASNCGYGREAEHQSQKTL